MRGLKQKIIEQRLLPEQCAFWYLGQEGILIRHQSEYLVVDPYLSDYVDRNCCTEQVSWKRLYDPPMRPEMLDFVDYVVLTHDHYDHADPDTIRGILSVNEKVRFLAPSPICETLLSYGIPKARLIPARAGEPAACGSFTVRPLPAAHEELHPDENGDYRELCYLIEFGSRRVFHGGDCCLYPGLEEALSDTDVMFLPVNGRSFYKLQNDIIGNMTAEEAVLLAKRSGAGMLVPIHYDLYEVNRVSEVHIVDAIERHCPEMKYHLFRVGEGSAERIIIESGKRA